MSLSLVTVKQSLHINNPIFYSCHFDIIRLLMACSDSANLMLLGNHSDNKV
jgi:hypothetical protein